MLSNKQSRKGVGPAERQGAGAILDGTLGFVAVILTSVLVAMIPNGFQPEVLLVGIAYAAVILLVARRHGWNIASYVRRLRSNPAEEQDRGSGASDS